MTSQQTAAPKPTRTDIDRWLAPPCPPERLAALRILISGFAVCYFAAAILEFARLVDEPSSRFTPRGIVRLLEDPLSPTVFWSWYGLMLASGIAFTAGARCRVTGPIFAVSVLFWASYHSSWGQILHFEHLLSLHLLVLAVAPVGDAWSVDARRSGRRRQASDSHGWTVRVLAIITVTTYVIAGITKLRVSGMAWIDGTTLTNHIAYSATRLDLLGAPTPPLSGWVVDRPGLLGLMAAAAVAIELLAPVALVGRVTKWIWSLAALGMHLGIVVLMGVFFPYQTLGFALLPLYRCERLLRHRPRSRPA